MRSLFIAGLLSAGLAGPTAAASTLAATGNTVLGPLVEVFLARHMHVLALAPIANPPREVAAIPPDSVGPAPGERRLPYPGAPGGEPAPRQRPATQTAVVIPSPGTSKAPDTILAAINAYQRFKSGILALAKVRLDQPENIRQAQKLLAGQNQVALARGWLAACSQIASKAGEFIAGLTGAAAKETPEALGARLEQRPADVWQVAGAQTASSAVLKQVATDTAIMATVAQRLIEVGYGRGKNEPQLASSAGNGNYGAAAAPPPAEPSAKARPMVSQILALGARMQLSQGGALPDQQGASNADNDQCLRWAQLNLNQCLAAAHGNAERAYCLGYHGIDERLKCWNWIAKGS